MRRWATYLALALLSDCATAQNTLLSGLPDRTTILSTDNFYCEDSTTSPDWTASRCTALELLNYLGGPFYIFKTISTPSGTSPVADSASDTLTLAASGIVTITGDSTTDTVTIGATEAQNIFQTISTPSGTSPVADATNDTLTLASGAAALSITGDSTLDKVTFDIAGTASKCARFDSGGELVAASADCASGDTDAQNVFQTIATTSGTSPVADSPTDTLTLTAGTGITITGDSSTDTVTIAATGSGSSGQCIANSNGDTDTSVCAGPSGTGDQIDFKINGTSYCHLDATDKFKCDFGDADSSYQSMGSRQLSLVYNAANSLPPQISFYKSRSGASVNTGDNFFNFYGYFKNSTPADAIGWTLLGTVKDKTAGSEDTAVDMLLPVAGATTPVLHAEGAEIAVNRIAIGNASQAGASSGNPCISASGARLYHDTNCNNTKDSGEEFIDQAGSGGAPSNIGDSVMLRKASFSYTKNADQVVTFTSEVRDDANYHDNITNTDRITFPAGGVYWCYGNVDFPSITGTFCAHLQRDGSYGTYYPTTCIQASGDSRIVVTGILDQSETNYIRLVIFNSGSGSLTVDSVQVGCTRVK
jgi:hypothetical protein